MKASATKFRAPVPPPQERAPADIQMRLCHGIGEFEACVAVERTVWKSADVDVVPIPLFVIASETGGQVIGAFHRHQLVGFIMAIAGWRDRKPFLHSHMMAVLDEFRDRGVGRKLKVFQRQDALARGISLIEWTFDPLVAKNAYLNLMRLGAIVRRYLPNAYGITTSPLHASLPTDRLVAEWHLRSPRVLKTLIGKQKAPAISKKAICISIPAGLEDLKLSAPDEAVRQQSKIREQFTHWLGKGYAAIAVSRNAAGMDYILEPWKRK